MNEHNGDETKTFGIFHYMKENIGTMFLSEYFYLESFEDLCKILHM